MDYIQQAIDKARQERQCRIGQAPREGQPPDRVTPLGRPEAPPAQPTRISYTQTRRVEIPKHQLEERRLFAAMPDDRRAEPYRQLRTQVLRNMRANDWQTIAITSPNSHAGKTLTAANLRSEEHTSE